MILKPEVPCKSCIGYSWGCSGFTPASGTGSNGVLLLGEASGEQEAQTGEGFVGKAGAYLFQQLGRVGIERDGFRIANVLSCRPPNNQLAGMPFESLVIASCSPLLDATIKQMQGSCLQAGRHFTILTLGKTAFKRVLGITEKSPLMKEDYLAYPHWSETYRAWIFAADHPSYLMRGNHHLAPVLQFIAKRALEVASNGLTLEKHSNYLLDPLPVHFATWAREYLANPERWVLSYDIETPFKQGADEDTTGREDDTDDQTILRCSFCWKPGHSASVPWTAPYMATIHSLFATTGPKVGWNSRGYDDERITRHCLIRGDRLDAMLAWHVLNSALPKGLAFVTPFYWQDTGMWKHLSQQAPAFYNAKDADAALRCWIGIEADLKANQQWEVFDRHVIKLNRVLDYMSGQGVLRDEVLRQEAETKLSTLLGEAETNIEKAVPFEAKRLKPYKKTPKDTIGCIQRSVAGVVKRCNKCGLENPKKPHFKIFKKKDNPCGGAQAVEVTETVQQWARVLPWKISKLGLMDYQRVKHHQPIFDRRTKKLTFDETALIKLQKRYPKDPLYPLVLDFRGHQKLLSVYVGVTQPDGRVRGGMPIGTDGRIHTQMTTDASTLRSTSRNPNLQNLPRAKGPADLATIIRNLIIPATGHIFTARDYCVSPDTKILKTDLTWQTAETIKVGDQLIGFDEDFDALKGIGKGKRASNKFRTSVVKSVKVISRPRVKVTTTKGTTTVSAEHRFVARSKGYNRKWVEAQNLRPGMIMPFLESPWETDQSREGGYLAGFLDGEGYAHRTNVGFGQNDGPVLQDVLSLLKTKGFRFTKHGRKVSKCFQYACISGIGHQLRLLGTLRPTRLLPKATSLWDGRQISSKCSERVEVVSVEPINDGDVVAIGTSTGTLITDGYFSHNCGIEAVLVGYEAQSSSYIRLAKLDVHSYYSAYALHELDGSVATSDLPDINWPDEKLIPCLAGLKSRLKVQRNSLYKHLVHGANFFQGAKGAQEKILNETGIGYDVSLVQKVMDIYFALFPEIKKWHKDEMLRAERDGFTRNAFGYIHRWSRVFDYEPDGSGGWTKEPGPQANQVIAFKPQSNAAGIIKEAMMRVFYNHFEEAGQYLRLLVHDELFLEAPEHAHQAIDQIVQTEMEKPIPELALPESWGMGPCLIINTEAKAGSRWGGMH